MEIGNTSLVMRSKHDLRQYTEVREEYEAWDNRTHSASPVQLKLSPKALKSLAEQHAQPAEPALLQAKQDRPAADEPTTVTEMTPEQRFTLRIVESLLERILGKRVKLDQGITLDEEKIEQMRSEIENEIKAATYKGNADTPTPVGWGVSYSYDSLEYEAEFSSFQASGSVTTTDGREISLDVELNLSREFVKHESFRFAAGDAVFMDPLVINLDGRGASFDGDTMAFDIDSDGEDETVSNLSAGSGFLAFDRNGNGEVDDGTELFGPESGNGFEELRQLDEDGNGWIDEGDSAFSKLQIWLTGGAEDRLTALSEVGVGAIYLGAADSEFTFTGDENDPLAKLRETGIFLYESGQAGFVQEVDLGVTP
jgi:hypothetical protein